MNYTKDEVLRALSHVDDPDFKKDIVSLNMVRNVVLEDNKLSFSVYLTTPACPMKDEIEKACRNAIKHFMPAITELQIEMTAQVTSSNKDKVTLPEVKNIIAVASGKGGVGKSTVSAGIAATLCKMGASVGLIDADIYGPSIPIMFGVQNHVVEVDLVEGKELMKPAEVNGLKIFSIGFLSKPDEAIVWRGPMASQALKQFIGGVNWGELDYLIIDLPPGTGDIQLTLVQTLPLTGAVIVTTPQKVALADAMRAANMFNIQGINIPIMGIVENMSYFTPNDAPDKKYRIFGEGGAEKMSEHFNVPILGKLPIQIELGESADKGEVMQFGEQKNFIEIAQQLAQNISINNAIGNGSVSKK